MAVLFQSFLDDLWNKSQNGSLWTNLGDGSFFDGNGHTIKHENPFPDPPTWLTILRGFQTKANNWATNGPSKWVVNDIYEARSRGGAREYLKNTSNGIVEIVGYSNKANQQVVINRLKEVNKSLKK